MIKNKFIVSGVLINSNYELLVFSKTNNVLSSVEFILPTTELLDNNSPEESIAKEINKISGLICDPDDFRPLIFVSHKNPLLIQLIYLLTKWDGKLNLGNVLKWVNVDQVTDYLSQDFYKDFVIKIVPLIKGLKG